MTKFSRRACAAIIAFGALAVSPALAGDATEGKNAPDAAVAHGNAPGSGDLVEINNTTGVIVRKLKIKVPANGYIIVIATWRFYTPEGQSGQCAITLNSKSYSDKFEQRSTNPTGSGDERFDNSTVTGQFFVKKGKHAVRLICKADTAETIYVDFDRLAAIFAKKRLK